MYLWENQNWKMTVQWSVRKILARSYFLLSGAGGHRSGSCIRLPAHPYPLILIGNFSNRPTAGIQKLKCTPPLVAIFFQDQVLHLQDSGRSGTRTKSISCLNVQYFLEYWVLNLVTKRGVVSKSPFYIIVDEWKVYCSFSFLRRLL